MSTKRLSIFIVISQWAVIFMSGAQAVPNVAKMRSVALSFDQEIQAPRWQYDAKAKVKGPAVVQKLVDVKKARLDRKFSDCIAAAKKGGQSAAGMAVWFAVTELDCAQNLAREDEGKVAPLVSALQTIVKHPQWLIQGPQVEILRPLFYESLVIQLERQIKSDRKSAWSSFDLALSYRRALSQDQLARLYRASGELAFLEQNIPLATDLYSRSLDLKETQEARRKLEALKSAVQTKKAEKVEAEKPESTLPFDSTGDEKELAERTQRSIQSGDLLAAIEDAVSLIEKFPGGTAAKWAADRTLEIYLSLGAKSEGQYPKLREKSVDLMLKLDSGRMYRMANNAFVKGFYSDAHRLAMAAYKKYQGHPDSTKALSIAANASLYQGEYSQAEEHYTALVNEHAGSDESKTALFRLGLIKFRAKKWSEASGFFERLLVLAPSSDWEYLALYWQWRCHQKLNSNQAAGTAEKLMTRYPLTYYGLRARAEANQGGLPSFKGDKAAVLKSEMWLTESQSQTWERFQFLLKSGWFDEAQAELNELPEPVTPEDRLNRARLLGAAFDHYQAIKIYSDVWQKKPELFSWQLLKWAFPLEYPNAVERESRANGLDASLIRGLARQESSFRPRAQSSANAYGVMQVVLPTAQEVVQSQKWKTTMTLPEDLFTPELNIRIGSIYLGRLVRAFKGHVPLAAAAYNAGIGRLRRWLQSRPDLGDLENHATSSPDDEVWIDELPWDETSIYVKAVLRNMMIYRWLEKGEWKLPEPIWKFSTTETSCAPRISSRKVASRGCGE